MNKYTKETRSMLLALYVLAGVLSRRQMRELAATGEIPETWEDIVSMVENLNATQIDPAELPPNVIREFSEELSQKMSTDRNRAQGSNSTLTSELDKKLEEILFNMASNAAEWGQHHPEMDVNVERMTSREIAADYPDLIKQAFRDTGWRRVQHNNTRRYKHILASDEPIMTGQEWYDAFEKQLPRLTLSGYPLTSFETKVMDAAKKAAGIE